jgi:hypothetical protein
MSFHKTHSVAAAVTPQKPGTIAYHEIKSANADPGYDIILWAHLR